MIRGAIFWKEDQASKNVVNQFTGRCEAMHEIIMAYLWERGEWVPTHELVELDRPHGHVANSGDVRARELTRNECRNKLSS